MSRLERVDFRGALLTEDTIKAVLTVIAKASGDGWQVDVQGGAAHMPQSGREIRIRLSRPDVSNPQAGVNMLWGYAVPLGLTPWCRYPVVGPDDDVFHFFGPWRILYDRLLAEGQGHLAWPSVCAAAQCDVGTWDKGQALERSLQAQLHRTGFNAGPIDGILGPRTTKALEQAGVSHLGLAQALVYLKKQPDAAPTVSERGRHVGHLALSGQRMSITAFGGVRAIAHTNGAMITVDGPGRLVVDIGD